MNELEFCDVLGTAIADSGAFSQEGTDEAARVRSFEDAGVLTENAGLIVRLPDGSEFQVTVVRRR